MSRDEFIKMFEEKIDNEPIKNKNKEDIIKNYKKCKNAIYFLYDKENIVIYVGKVGKGKKTSFAHRMYLHGNGAHCNKSWFNEVERFKVKEFKNLSAKELSYIERLMIYAKRQPKFNDSYITEDKYEEIVKKS